ncbi:MAG: Apolipoprotein N-acyltransferase [Phycisphaerales bacterium]|nr:Apolipoprotein N-acyltransferase [Phycisphaerales bacterium]
MNLPLVTSPNPTPASTPGTRDRSATVGAAPWKRAAFGAGIVHALLMTLAFDPVGLWPAALFAVAPLAWLGFSGRLSRVRWWKVLAVVTAGILPFHLFQQAWIIDVSPIGYPLLAAYVAVFSAAFVLLCARVAGRVPRWWLPLASGVLWSAVEVFRGDVLFKGYGWFNVAHPVVDWPWAAAPAAVTGQYGVTLLVATVGACIAAAVHRPRLMARWATILAGVLGVWAGLAAIGAAQPTANGPTLRVGVVQTNLPQSNKQAPTFESTLNLWNSLRTLTLEAADAAPPADIIVWPETMKPGLALDAESVAAERRAQIAIFPSKDAADRTPLLTASFAGATVDLQSATGIPLLVGEDAYDGLRFETKPSGSISVDYRHRYNSAFLVRDGAVQPARYDKVRLTPFGEEMPYISAWPWLERQLLDLAARGMKLDLSAGSSLTVFNVPMASGGEARLVTPICFEATEWDLCRRMIFDGSTRRADVLVNMTNDGWFGWWRGGRLQHLQIARWRCIELATPMIRAANTGISCSIDARGKVTRIAAGPQSTDWNQPGVLIADVTPGHGATLMARGGWITGWAVLGAGLVMLMVPLIPRRSADRTTLTTGA